MKKILLVEDEQNLLDIYCEFFKSNDFECITAEDGITALKLFEEIRPDIVITDIKLSGLTGIEVLMEMKQMEYKIPIIVITGVLPEKYGGYLTNHVEAVFTKPVTLSALLAKVKELV